MIKYDYDQMLRCMLVSWEKKYSKNKDMRKILYPSPYYKVSSYFFVNEMIDISGKVNKRWFWHNTELHSYYWK